MHVLITNLELWPLTGTVGYVRDIALELQRQGHTPEVLSSTGGPVADELRTEGIAVANRPSQIRHTPEVIHGHHHAPTLVALRRWPRTPAIHVCHDHLSPYDATPLAQNIWKHFGVSRVCVQRLVDEGVPAEDAQLFPNFVDTTRFWMRGPLPARPRRALVFSNYATEGTQLLPIAAACREAGIELDIAGSGAGRFSSKPEDLLPGYDLVFARGRAALEAMAAGTAVVLCDFAGVGPMVTAANFDQLRPLNFGFEALTQPLDPSPLAREIALYDPDEATRVRDLVRSQASLTRAVETLVGLYQAAISERPPDHASDRPTPRARQAVAESVSLRLYWAWHSLPAGRMASLRRLPGTGLARRALRRLLRSRGSAVPRPASRPSITLAGPR